jgi:probable rRNA maturation factor
MNCRLPIDSYVHHSKPDNTAKAPIGNWQLAIGNSLPQITVCNRQRRISVNVAELQKFAVKAMQHSLQLQKGKQTDLRRLADIFVWLVSDRRMARLHLQFLGQAGPTDVLTFQHGEIFVSVEMAKRHAYMFGNSLIRELQLYIVHGFLHLHGFNDRTQSGARKMKRAQEKILRHAVN